MVVVIVDLVVVAAVVVGVVVGVIIVVMYCHAAVVCTHSIIGHLHLPSSCGSTAILLHVVAYLGDPISHVARSCI